MQRVMKRLVRIFMTNNMQLRQRSVAGWSIPAGSMVGLWCCLLLGMGSVGLPPITKILSASGDK